MRMRVLGAVVGIGLVAGCAPEEAAVEPPPAVPIVAEMSVSGGIVRGSVGEDGLKQFHGIPFAAPPVGELRWAPPAPVPPWSDVKEAIKPGPSCVQPLGGGGSFYGVSDIETSEDCLTLNVWTRAAHVGQQLPVMVWIHGGALVSGTGSSYPGESLTNKAVVLVTANYRLGRFGFLAHPALSQEHPGGVSGNQGLRDQIAALEWVRDNIEQFGGDPNNVTIFGESAGSLSMSLLQASPLAKGLFHRVIGQSGGAFQPMWWRDKATSYAASAESIGEMFAAALAGEEGDASLAALRALPADHIMEVIQSDPEFSNYDALAIVDGEVIPDEVATIFAQGQQADVPVLIGSNADEATTFMEFFMPLFGTGVAGFNAYAQATVPEVVDEMAQLYPAENDEQAVRSWVDLFGDALFAYPMREWATSMGNVSSDAYLYWFTWAPPVENSEQYGAFHAAEIGYVFGNLDLFGAVPTDADREFGELMANIWTQFAKTGSPNGEGLPEWPAYTPANEAYMELGQDTGAKSQLRIEQMALIKKAWAARRSAEQPGAEQPSAEQPGAEQPNAEQPSAEQPGAEEPSGS